MTRFSKEKPFPILAQNSRNLSWDKLEKQKYDRAAGVAGAAFLVRAGSYTTVNMAEKRGHPSDATETSSDPTTLPTSSSQAGDIILTTKALQESTLEDSTRYAAHTRTPAVHPTISGLSTRSCSHQDRL